MAKKKNKRVKVCELGHSTIGTFKFYIRHKIVWNGLTTVVILKNGTKGIAKCNPKDKYNSMIGYKIAFYRALQNYIDKELNVLYNNDILDAVKKLDKEINQEYIKKTLETPYGLINILDVLFRRY